MIPYNETEQQILDLIKRATITNTFGAIQNQRLVFGGIRGSGGGEGGPIMPFIGKIRQTDVTFDTDEFATGTIPSGEGASLLTNLNRIRAGYTAHNLLSTTHGDTLAASPPTRGSLVAANATPKWSEFALAGATGSVLTRNATDPAWSGFYLSGTAGGTTTLAVTNAKTLTLTATDSYNLTIPATGTVALLTIANVFTATQTISNTAPTLIMTDTTGAAKSLTIAVDANIVDLRESAGASGSLLVLDLANNRVGIGTAAPTSRLHVLYTPTNASSMATKVEDFLTSSADGTYNTYAMLFDARDYVSTGKTNSGQMIGVQGTAYKYGAGTLATAFGGYFVGGTTGTDGGTVTTAYGIFAGAAANSGTVTTGYGVYCVSYCTTNYALYAAAGNAWFVADVSALTFTDRTLFYEGDALNEIKKIKGDGKGNIDHDTLPAFVRREVRKQDMNKSPEIVPSRDLGGMVSMLTVAVQQLAGRIEKLESNRV
jgi:hypothetical protein